MRNLIVVGGLMLGLGFAIGWIAKPVPSGKTAESRAVRPSPDRSVEAPASPPAAISKTKSAVREPTKPQETPPGISEQAKSMQADASKMIVDRLRSRLEKRIATLTEELDLTVGQTDLLTTWLNGKMKGMETLDFQNPESMNAMTTTMQSLNEKSLDAELEASLSAEQTAAMGDFKSREHQNKVDSTALKNLSKLRGIIQLEEGQQEAVYQALVKEADATVQKANDRADMPMMNEELGIDMDPYGLGLMDMMYDIGTNAGESGEMTDPQSLQKHFKQNLERRINEKIELMRPVLNEKQLGQYRTELEKKGAGFFGNAFSGMPGK